MMLYRTLDAVMPAFRGIFNEFGITEQQWRVLRILWEDDGVSLHTLAEATLIPGPSLVGVIDRLVRDSLVERRRSKVDRRVVHINITRKGKALEASVQPRVDDTSAALEASISQTAWKSLFKAMDEIERKNTATTTLSKRK